MRFSSTPPTFRATLAWRDLEERWYPRDHEGRCRRLVLDTGVAWHAHEHILAALQARGFLMSLAPSSVMERWARAASERQPGKLLRAQVLGRYIDPELPVAPTGRAIELQLGRIRPDEFPDHLCQDRLERVTAMWAHLVARGLPDNWVELGGACKQWLDAEAAEWLGDFKNFASAGVRADVRSRGEADALAYARQHTIDAMRSSWRMPGPPELRAHSWCSVQAWHIVQAALGKTHPANSREDLRLVQHLVTPCMIACDDHEYIRRVDASGAAGASWIRTPAELLWTMLPGGRPWGSVALGISAEYVRPNLHEWRKRLTELARDGGVLDSGPV